jgi:uncharacterized membrane protein YfcA
LTGGELAGLALAGLVAGAVNTVAGGGSFVTVAALVAMGLPVSAANATSRVGVLVQSSVAAASFRARGVSGGGDLRSQVAVSVVGAAVGALLSLWIDPKAFEQALAVGMVVTLSVSLLRPRSWTTPGPPSPWRWPALFATSVYGGFIQAGVGVLMLPCLIQLGGVNAVSANARKALLLVAFNLPSLLLYVWADLVIWDMGLVLALSSAVGGWIGAHLTVGYGPRFVWVVMVGVVFLTVGRLVM